MNLLRRCDRSRRRQEADRVLAQPLAERAPSPARGRTGSRSRSRAYDRRRRTGSWAATMMRRGLELVIVPGAPGLLHPSRPERQQPGHGPLSEFLYMLEPKTRPDQLVQQLGQGNVAYACPRPDPRADSRPLEDPLGIPIAWMDDRHAVRTTVLHLDRRTRETGMDRDRHEEAIGGQDAPRFSKEGLHVVEVGEGQDRYDPRRQQAKVRPGSTAGIDAKPGSRTDEAADVFGASAGFRVPAGFTTTSRIPPHQGSLA